MKRAVVLVVALGMIVTGFMMDGPNAHANTGDGNHFISGKIIAVDACYRNETRVGETCVAVVESNGSKHGATVTGDVVVDKVVYRECTTTDGELDCSKEWLTSVGEVYLAGGEITQ